jgi:dihydrofolate reductase
MITIIAAISKNNAIGKDNKLLWHISEDLKRFKRLTSGNPILMGRKTFESIGKPLPYRTNIILTKDKNYKADGCLVYNKVEDVLSLYERNNLYIIGGGEIYKQFIKIADRLEITLVESEFEGDTFFPKIGSEWFIEKEELGKTNEYNYKFLTFKKKS